MAERERGQQQTISGGQGDIIWRGDYLGILCTVDYIGHCCTLVDVDGLSVSTIGGIVLGVELITDWDCGAKKNILSEEGGAF